MSKKAASGAKKRQEPSDVAEVVEDGGVVVEAVPELEVALVSETPRTKAQRLMARRGRAYRTQGGKYINVSLHAAVESEVRLIADVFGGNYYKHQSGWQWKSSDRKVIERVRQAVETVDPADKNRRYRPFFEEPDALEVETELNELTVA